MNSDVLDTKLVSFEEEAINNFEEVTPIENLKSTEAMLLMLSVLAGEAREISNCSCNGFCGGNFRYSGCSCNGFCGSNYRKD
mgnify:CR=1 FL=1